MVSQEDRLRLVHEIHPGLDILRAEAVHELVCLSGQFWILLWATGFANVNLAAVLSDAPVARRSIGK